MTKTKSQKARAKARAKQRSQQQQTKVPQSKSIVVQSTRTSQRQPRYGNGRMSGFDLIMRSLSPCAFNYAACLANPFTGPMGCVPTFPALMTRKFRVFSRGILVTSTTTSTGFICCDPLNFACNDRACLFYTGAGYLVNGFMDMSGVAGVTSAVSNSDYSFNQFADPVGANLRVVGFGIRIMYEGSMTNEGGLVCGLQEPDHQTLQAYSMADMGIYDESRRYTVRRGVWYTINYKPVNNGDLIMSTNAQFPSLIYVAATKSATIGNYLGFLIQSATAATPFLFEVYGVYEASGPPIRGKSQTEVDYHGFSKVQTATADMNFDHDGTTMWTNLKSVVSGVYENRHEIGNVLKTIGSGIKSFSQKAVPMIEGVGITGIEVL